MSTGPLSRFLGHFRRRVALGADEQTDGQLLQRFAQGRDEGAFAALVRRHGPLVLGVCRRLLRDPNDADDAFQAAFLVLARKAGSIGDPGRLANWLYGVAHRVARKARAEAARRRARQQPLTDVPAHEPDRAADGEDLRRVLDDEVQRLPDKFRAPLVLCYLQGKTREEAAAQLGWGPGAVKGMLERGREVLRARLTRRGLGPSAGALAGVLSGDALAAVPVALGDSTVKAALAFAAGPGAAAGNAAALAEGVLHAMWTTRMRAALAVVLVLGLAGAGAGVLAFGGRPAEGPAQPKETGPAPKAAEKPGPFKRLARSRLNAAKTAYEAYWLLYQAGREGEQTVNLWSRRWLQAQLDLSDNKADRDAALAAHRDRLAKVDAIARARLDLGGSTRSPESVAAEKKHLDAAWKAYLDGTASEESVCRASVHWLMFQHSAHKFLKVDRKAELQAHLDRMKEVEKITRARFDAGKSAIQAVRTAEFHRLEAEEWLARGKTFGENALWPGLPPK
jgi:RNA polymerase sigma factor (sigma-70 family)